jgi:hypothetical protein
MPPERPYPGQFWKRDGVHMIVVAVHPTIVTYEPVSRGPSVTESLGSFLGSLVTALASLQPLLCVPCGSQKSCSS